MVSGPKGYIGGGRGRLKEGARDSSLWWRMVSSIRGGVELVDGSWFEDNVCRVVGGGGSTFFGLDNWVGGVPLRVRFPRLFDLEIDKLVTVQEMERRGWGLSGDAWVWRRRLLAWEEETVSECAPLLCNVVLQDHVATKGVSQYHLLSFDNNKVLKTINWTC